MAIMEISIVPVGTPTPSVSQYVAGAVRILRDEKGIRYELTPMGTVIEGELDTLLSLAGRMHSSAFDAGAMRVVTSIKLDERRDKPSSMGSKLEAVRAKLGK
jgi:uncharacterized protein (TIGR00106 family)